MRRPTGAIVRQEPALLKFVYRDTLRDFYVRQCANAPPRATPVPADEPFLPELRECKMRRLHRLFTRHIRHRRSRWVRKRWEETAGSVAGRGAGRRARLRSSPAA